MKPFKLASILVILFVFSILFTVLAQDQDSCSAIVEAALMAVDDACEGTGRNQACYGNFRLDTVFRTDDSITFDQQGDLVDVAAIESFTLSPMDVGTNAWGVALMRIQANLPDTLPGQNITFLLFGDIELDNAVNLSEKPVQLEATVISNANVRSGPSTAATIIGSLAQDQEVIANGRLADSSWLRILLLEGGIGWVFAPLMSSTEEVNTLSVVEPGDPSPDEPFYSPMQAIYFRSGTGDAPCAEAPDSGILIQTPEGVGKINLLINEVSISLSSTVFLQAEAPGNMIINGIENQGIASAYDASQTVLAGTRVLVPLDENGVASGPPSMPEPYDYDSLHTLPLEYLDRPITLPQALTQPEIVVLTSVPTPTKSVPVAERTFTDMPNDVFTCDQQTPATDPEVDIVQIRAYRSSDHDLIADVQMAEPLTNDFSFAVMLALESGDAFQFFIWEIHDNQFRIGELDAQTGELIPVDENGVRIDHDRSAGIVSFSIPAPDLPAQVDRIGARSFHTPDSETQPQPKNCDFAGQYDLPEALQ